MSLLVPGKQPVREQRQGEAVKQAPLFRREKPTLPAKQKAAQAGQLEAARIILADPERYSGLQASWARCVVEKASEAQPGPENRTTGLETSGMGTET